MNKLLLLFLLILLNSCKESENERITNLVKKWNGKEIIFPSYAYFTTLGHDTVRFDFVEKNTYSIVTYVDSIGCISCKLKLDRWTSFYSGFGFSHEFKCTCVFFSCIQVIQKV